VTKSVYNKTGTLYAQRLALLRWGNTEMDMLAHCRAMAAFCRQRANFEDENDAFWIGEAKEWDKLIFEYATLQPQIRTGQTAPGKSALTNDRDDAKLSNILLTQMTLGHGRRVP
jgi:hypothetical protein